MRILIKGGVWKNTEDEVLKAAVMKYGKNQWARVASLLNRKSAKQCKARWYEWLDPSIKKTEWNKEEEEKLLHLAKLMPNQWRTIAPIVGRTAGQCIEHYERLLDMAQEDMAEDVDDDPRRLRPGEIDPTPETKPARPDPIDMDEDEKEMLSEAKARLANTKGKKAKRKARERQLDESRRLAMLQKRRELKAAGIESKLGGFKKRKNIDYGREIPFQKVAPAGFYDVREEDQEAKRSKLDPKLQGIELGKLEGRHDQEDEERAKQRDKKVLKTMFKDNAPLAIMKISAENDPTALRRRAPLSLPTPQVSDSELEDIVKLSSSSNLLMGPPQGVPHATQALVGDYNQAARVAAPTPLRTPMQENIVMQEAKNLRILREMTPMTGQDLPQLYEGTGFEGVAPRSAKLATANTVLGSVHGTPLVRSSGTPMITNGGSSSASVMTSRTPLRDQFGLNASSASADWANDGDSFSVSDVTSISSRVERQREQQLRAQISSQLRNLPEPEYTYDVTLPQLDAEEGTERNVMTNKPEDAADTRAARQEALVQQEKLELSRRSSVLQRGLPRPLNISSASLSRPSFYSTAPSTEQLQGASQEINAEMVQLLLHDAHRFPVEVANKVHSAKVARTRAVDLEQLSDEYLQQARDAVAEETAAAMASEESREAVSSFGERWEEVYRQLLFVPNAKEEGGGSLAVPTGKAETLTALSTQYAALRVKFDRDVKKAGKLEAKLQVTTQGYSSRSQQLQQSVLEAYDLYTRTLLELACCVRMRNQENVAIPSRVSLARGEALRAEEAEKEMQQQYAAITKYAKSVGVSM